MGANIEKCLNLKKRIPEVVIEDALIEYLIENEWYLYNKDIKSQEDLQENFRKRIEELNNIKLSDNEFKSFFESFNSGNFFERFSSIHSDQKQITIDNKIKTLKYFDFENIENNKFEIVNQMWTTSDDGNKRFDVNILINGIPIVHIELKKEDVNVKEAVKQIIEYKEKQAIKSMLDFTHIFITSNFTETYYFSNNIEINERFHFKWSDENNNAPFNLFEFSKTFLNKKILLDIIDNFFVCDTSKKIVKICRPYQYHAIKKIISKVNNEQLSNKEKSGYVWHATGSGKTLTSFKVCENLCFSKNVDNVVFLVDRKDLNSQSKNDFISFTTRKKIVLDATDSEKLYEYLMDKNNKNKIIISTIQKFNNILDEKKYPEIVNIKNNKIVFIVDECHRTQIGIMRNKIDNFFVNAINIAFTGTPIFDVNAGVDGKTTENIFGKEIHRYTPYNAINDNNVLPISFTHVESINTNEIDNTFDDDIDELNNFDKKIDMGYIEEISNYIKETFNKLTANNKFNAILAASSIPEAIEYYKMIKKISNINVGIIFSISDSLGTNMKIKEDIKKFYLDVIKEYNPSWDLDCQEQYKNQIVNDFKSNNGKVQLMIVVSMLLTGFDSPMTNTLYLDKSLRYQGLVQAVSRTNRVLDISKKTGQVISFKTSEESVKQAFELYTNGGINTPCHQDELWKPISYNSVKSEFVDAISKFQDKFKDSNNISNLIKEDNREEFLNAFKALQDAYSKIRVMVDFDWDQFKMTERDYKKFFGKYKELVEDMKNRRIVYFYNDYELVEISSYEIDAKFLSSLLIQINQYKGDIPDNIEDFELYKNLEENFIESVSNETQKEIILNFIKRKQIYYSKDFKDLMNEWTNYINELIEKTTNNAMIKWKCTSKAIEKLMDYYIYKKEITADYANEILPEYVDDIISSDEKIPEIEDTIRKLIVLEEISKIQQEL